MTLGVAAGIFFTLTSLTTKDLISVTDRQNTSVCLHVLSRNPKGPKGSSVGGMLPKGSSKLLSASKLAQRH